MWKNNKLFSVFKDNMKSDGLVNSNKQWKLLYIYQWMRRTPGYDKTFM